MFNLRVIIGCAFLALVATGRGATVLEDIIEKTFPIDPGATLAVRNQDGSIWVYGADVKELKVQAIKKAYTQDRLDRIGVNISIAPGQISIDTSFPPQAKWGVSDRSGTVDYIIVVPWTCNIARLDLATGEVLVDGMRGGNVHASLTNGRLFAHNCFTDLHLRLANGGLDVMNDWWERHAYAVDAQVVNGNVRVFIPDDATVHARASSINGHVVCDFLDKEHRQPGGSSSIDVEIGGPSENDLNVHAINGSIKIAEANP
jgi:hypothetical protein